MRLTEFAKATEFYLNITTGLQIKLPTCFGEICLNSPGRTQFRDSLSQSSWKKIYSADLGTNSHIKNFAKTCWQFDMQKTVTACDIVAV